MRVLSLIFIFIVSCAGPFEKGSIEVTNKRDKARVLNISYHEDQIVITGDNLTEVKTVKIKGQDGVEKDVSVKVINASQLVIDTIEGASIVAGEIFDLIISDAHGSNSFGLTVTASENSITSDIIVDGSITHEDLAKESVNLEKLSTTGVSAGDVIQFDGTEWKLSNLNGLTYRGSWDATTTLTSDGTDLVNASCDGKIEGDYFVVSNSGNSNISGESEWVTGDWVICSNSDWLRINNATKVSSVFGRTGAVSAALSDLDDVEVQTVQEGHLLIYNSANNRFENFNWLEFNTVNGQANFKQNVIIDGSLTVGAKAVCLADGTNCPVASPNVSNGSGAVDIDASSGSDDIDLKVGGVTQLKVDNTGNIGIGDLSPTTKLSVVDTEDVTLGSHEITTIKTGNNAGDAYLSFGYEADGSDTTANTITSGNSLPLVIKTDSSPNALTVLDNGNVGIGVSNPTDKFEVNGNIRANQICDESGANCKDISTGWDYSAGSGLSLSGKTFSANLSASHIPNLAASKITSGTLSDARLSSNVTKLGSTITPNEISNGAGLYFTYRPNNTACSNNQVLKWNSTNSRWQCASDSNSGGDITGVTAGTGLSGGGSSGAPTLNIANTGISAGTYAKLTVNAQGQATAGSGLAASDIPNLAASKITSGTLSDARLSSNVTKLGSTITPNEISNGAGLYFTYRPNNTACSNNQVLKWNTTNSRWQCASDSNSTTPADNTVNSAKVVDNSLGAIDLAANSVGASELADNAVDTAAIANSAVTNAKISSVDASKITSGTINNARLNATITRTIFRGDDAASASAPAFSFDADTDTGIYQGGVNELRFVTAGANRVEIDASGNVGIGNTAPGAKLDVSGSIRASNLILTSDRKFKKDIKEMSGSLEKISKLRAVEYFWRIEEFPKKNFSKNKQLGFIAQEIRKIFPEAVYETDNGDLGVNYPILISPMAKAISELNEKNNKLVVNQSKLSSEMENLKKQNEDLKKEIAAIKAMLLKR